MIMLRWLCLLFLFCLTLSVNAHAKPSSKVLEQQIQQLTEHMQHYINQLPSTKGELRVLTEYRINQKNSQIRNLIKQLMHHVGSKNAKLINLVNLQIGYVQQSILVVKFDIENLQRQLGTKNDYQIMILIAKRSQQLGRYLQQQQQNIRWLQQLSLPSESLTKEILKQLTDRADSQSSLLLFTQSQLKSATSALRLAGKHASKTETQRVLELQNLLTIASANLVQTIEQLDSFKQNTDAFKQVLFKVSGDIANDGLNFKIAQSLVEQWLVVMNKQIVLHGPTYLFKFFIFVSIILISLLLANVGKRIIRTAVVHSSLNLSHLLQDFCVSLSSKIIISIGILIAISQLGVEIGPLLAGFSIAGIVIGFALKDTLSNFASGMMILIYRPYDVGDLITAAGVTGKVSHMSLVSTIIKTTDNQRLIIPNNKIWRDTINNITVEFQRRVDMEFCIGYGDDIELAEKLLTDIVTSHPKVLKEPEVMIKLHNLGDSSVDFIVRPWVKPEDYWDVYWDITKEVKLRFDREGISIPFPQRDVHIYPAVE